MHLNYERKIRNDPHKPGKLEIKSPGENKTNRGNHNIIDKHSNSVRRSFKCYFMVFQIALNLKIPDDASEECYGGINEIDFSLEPCLFSQQG